MEDIKWTSWTKAPFPPERPKEEPKLDEWQKVWKPLVDLRNDREIGIKHMFYEWDKEMEIMQKIQKCQRVWDHSKTMIPEVIDYLLWTAQNAPSKQHEAYYEVYWTADRKVLDELSKYTWGCTHCRIPPSTWQNSQMNANMYMLFVAKEPDTQLNANADGTLKGNEVAARWENAYVSIGIAMGLVMRAAASIGFSTGCNIGFPKEGVERWESDQTELAIGAANGSNLTTTDMDKNPKTGKKFRKIKIVDIKKHAGETIQCPNGDWHKIPEKADIKINTMRVRHIDIHEIK